MVKNKKVYALVVVNLAVWSWFAYRIYSFLQEEEPPFSEEAPVILTKQKTQEDAPHIIKSNYPDPFLKDVVLVHKKQFAETNGKNNINHTPVKVKIQTSAIKPPEEKPHDIRYMGLVENKSNGISTAMIYVNGKSYLIKKGDMVQDIVFNNITKDNIEVKIGKEKMTISK